MIGFYIHLFRLASIGMNGFFGRKKTSYFLSIHVDSSFIEMCVSFILERKHEACSLGYSRDEQN